jgi:hypothetical protein
MRRYTIIHPLYLSFFSKSLYKDVAGNWPGLGLGYLLSLLALCLIPQVMTIQADLTAHLDSEAPKIIRQFPTVTITGGEASIGKPQPYFIRDEKAGKPVMIIDTTGSITSLKGTTATVLLTKKALIVRNDDDRTKTFDLSNVGNLTLGKTELYNLMDTCEKWFAVMIFPFALLISFAFHSAEVLIYAATASLFLRNSGQSLPFRTVFRLAAVAITPVMIAGTLLLIAGAEVPYWWLLGFLLAMAYLWYGIRAALEKEGIVA